MDCWLLEDAQEVPRGTKAGNAALLGLILGGAAGFFAWLIWYCLNDSIYLEADFENRYGIPVLGVLTEKRDAFLQKELETALAVRLKGQERVCVVDAAQTAGRRESASAGSCLKDESVKISPEWEECLWPFDEGAAERMRRSGVLLMLPWGKGSGRMAGRLVNVLEKLEVPVVGAVIYGAKDGFLRAYYGKKGGRA